MLNSIVPLRTSSLLKMTSFQVTPGAKLPLELDLDRSYRSRQLRDIVGEKICEVDLSEILCESVGVKGFDSRHLKDLICTHFHRHCR